MTARVGLRPNVSVSSESNSSYFSQYYAIVSRSIWDPLALGVCEGAKDLAQRAVILTTVLLGCCLIIAVVYRCFWRCTPPPSQGTSTIERTSDKQEIPRRSVQAQSVSKISLEQLYSPQNLNDICNAPHTHHGPIDLALSQEQILQLCDIDNLQEEECIYTGDLTVEKEKIESLMHNLKTKALVEFSSRADPYMYTMGALFVLLGIKPALVMETKPDPDLSRILKELTQEHSNLCFLEVSNVSYFVNEAPLSSFDPRQFLNLSSEKSLREAVVCCFSAQTQRNADQFLSYLLGFGPSWEAYATNVYYLEKNNSCMFNNNHYYEIGNVLNQSFFKKNEVRSEIEKLGFKFHSQCAPVKKRPWTRKKSLQLYQVTAVEQMLGYTGTNQVFDGLTARTDYFKKSYALKKWVMETYLSQLLYNSIIRKKNS